MFKSMLSKSKQIYNFNVNTTNLTCLLRKSEDENYNTYPIYSGDIRIGFIFRGCLMKPEIIIRNFFKKCVQGVIRIFQIDIWQIKYWHIKLYLKRNKQYTDAKDYAEHVRDDRNIWKLFIRNSRIISTR